jgi:membrane-associated phospholipid phosphatase
VPVTIAVLVAALVAATVIGLLSRRAGAPDPVDPEWEERWLVRWFGGHPHARAVARSLDRHVVGGLLLVIALATVFSTALAVGIVFDMVDRQDGLARWDRSVAAWGADNAASWSTDLLDWLTDLGGTTVLVVLVVAVACLDYWRHRNGNVILFLAVVVVGVLVLNNAVKMIVDRPRPDVPHLVGAAGSSFPSGHSASAAAAWFAVALVVGRHWSPRGRAAVAAVAALATITVAASRALLGVHWLTDVVAGVMLGFGWFVLCAVAFGGRLQRLGEPAERVAGATTPTVQQR